MLFLLSLGHNEIAESATIKCICFTSRCQAKRQLISTAIPLKNAADTLLMYMLQVLTELAFLVAQTVSCLSLTLPEVHLLFRL